jgi:hypothetical protein
VRSRALGHPLLYPPGAYALRRFRPVYRPKRGAFDHLLRSPVEPA